MSLMATIRSDRNRPYNRTRLHGWENGRADRIVQKNGRERKHNCKHIRIPCSVTMAYCQTWESFVVIVDLGFGGCRCRSMHVYKLDWYHGSPRQNAARLGDSWPRNHGWMESWVGYASGRRNNRGSPPGI